MSTASIAALIARLGLVSLFMPFSALDKVFGFAHAVRQAQQVFRPRGLAIVVLLCGLAIELVCSIGVVSGLLDRAAAFVLAGYCVATAVLYKRFWVHGDFWSDPEGKGRSLFWDFLKNLSLGAGFLVIVVGTDGTQLHAFLDAPFTSSHPYRSQP